MTAGRPIWETGHAWLPAIPGDWQFVPSKALFANRAQPSTAHDPHLTPSQKYGVVTQDRYMQLAGSKVVLNLTGADSMKHVEPGDFIIHLRSFQGGLERSSLKGKVSLAYTVLRPRQGVLGRYFEYLLKSDRYIQAIRVVVNQLRDGQSIRYQDFGKVSLPLPPPREQQVIADFLDRETAKIDALIEKQGRLIGLLQERRQHVIAGALQASDGAPAVPLKRALVRIQQGISPDTSSGTEDADVWVLKTGATNHGVFDENESKPVPAHVVVPPGIEVRVGDLLVSRASGSPDLVGSAAIVRALGRRAILSDKTFRLVPSPYEALPRFLYWFLNSPSYRSQVRLAISGADGLANNLPLSSLRRMRLQLPPLQDQQVIAASLDRETAKIDALIAKAEEFVALAQERRAALTTAAVTGQIDVLGEAG